MSLYTGDTTITPPSLNPLSPPIATAKQANNTDSVVSPTQNPSIPPAVSLQKTVSSAELISPLKTLSQHTTNIPIAIRIRLKKAWHSYWQYPGEAGQALKIQWQLPEGMTATPLQWPIPVRITSNSITTFGYKKQFLVFSSLYWKKPHLAHKKQNTQNTLHKTNTPHKTQIPHLINITANIKWLICKEICIPMSNTLSLNFPITSKAEKNPLHVKLFNQWLKKIPKLGYKSASLLSYGNFWKVFIPSPSVSAHVIQFFPMSPQIFSPKKPRIITNNSSTQHSLLVEKSPYYLGHKKAVPATTDTSHQKKALIVFQENQQNTGYIFSFKKQGSYQILWFLLLAFLGGVLLNFMPCVLPIVFLKFSNTMEQVHENYAKIIQSNIFYSAGVISSFLVLAGLLVSLKKGGESIGWGFQMQSPYFLISMTLLFTIISFNFMGWLPVPLLFKSSLDFSHQKKPESTAKLVPSNNEKQYQKRLRVLFCSTMMYKHFLTGVLSTVAASPCTVPFMGAAIGYGLSVGQTWEIILIFSFLGMGLSFPYLLLSVFPRCLRYVPYPGRWNEQLKQFMAFPMLATSAWLLSLINQQQPHMILPTLMSLILLALCFWGLNQTFTKSRWLFKWLIVVALLVPFISLYSKNQKQLALQWETFSVQKMEEMKKHKQALLVIFSAKWCLSCQFNDFFTFKNKQVIQFIKDRQIRVLKGDWTDQNTDISQVLEHYNKAGIPFYLYFPPLNTTHKSNAPPTSNSLNNNTTLPSTFTSQANTIDSSRKAILLPEILTPTIFFSYVK